MKWYQLHLTTLLLLTVLAGAFVGAQFWTRRGDYIVPPNVEVSFVFPSDFDPHYKVRGWPVAYEGWLRTDVRDWFKGWALVLNAMLGIVALAIMGYCVERINGSRKA